MNPRKAELSRTTHETQIRLMLDLDGRGRSAVNTGVGFFDHMLDLLAKHGLFDLTVEASGDLRVDDHHTVEDVGIVLGQAMEHAIGDKRGINRYGWASVPMDESLANVAVDLGGRPSFVYQVDFAGDRIGNFATELVEEFWKSVANTAKLNLHVTVPYGSNNHHIAEAIFKSAARALRMAVAVDPKNNDIPSTKGALTEPA